MIPRPTKSPMQNWIDLSKKQVILWYMLAAILIQSCGPEKKIVPEQKIFEPPTIITAFKAGNMLWMDSSEVITSRIKIYIPINMSCPTCIEKIAKWKDVAAQLKPNKIPIIFLGHAEDRFIFFKFLAETGKVDFPYPFFLDTKNEMLKKDPSLRSDNTQNAIVTNTKGDVFFSYNPLSSVKAKEAFINEINNLAKR